MAYRWSLVILLCICKTPSLCGTFNDVIQPTNISEVNSNIVGLINSITKSVYPLALRVAIESNISTSCSLSLLRLFTAIKELKKWALTMLDANAKLPSGFLQGNFLLFGDYDECLDISATDSRGKVHFKGKYCMLELWMKEFLWQQLRELKTKGEDLQFWNDLANFTTLDIKPPPLRLGLCVPSTCTSQEISQLVHIVTRAFGVLPKATCETKMNREPNTEQIVFLCIFAAIVLMVIIGTVVDIINQHCSVKMKSGELNKFLIAFSFYSNTVRLFRAVQYDDSLPAIHGFRVLTIFWVILVHIYFFPNFFYFLKYRRLLAFHEFDGEIMFRTITSATASVDTFFLLSGMLSVYTGWRKREGHKELVHPVTHFRHRTMRFVSIGMLIIALFMILPLFGNGPIWDETFKEGYAACKNNWWTNLLFIQNFWPNTEICLPHTWFISALFQLTLLTFWVNFVLYRWPKIGVLIYILLILTGCFVTGFVTSSYNLPSYCSVVEEKYTIWYQYFQLIHIRPYTYCSSYCIGSLLGYAIITKRHLKIKPWIQFMLWFMATCGALIVLYGVYFMNRNTKRELKLTYAALHRAVWSSCISWIVFACLTGYGGIIGKFLSWRGMIPLDRLVFLLYLLHPLVMIYHTARTRAAIYLGHVEKVYIYLATIVITLCLSYVFNVTIEQPLMYIESFIFRKFSKKPSPDVIRPTITSAPTNNFMESHPGIIVTSVKPIVEENNESKL